MARPTLQLDERQIKKLAEIQCTMIEIASVMNCSVDTLENRYSDIIKSGQASGKSSLRRMQYKKAMEGNATMLIWLGKHYLDQKDSVQVMNTTEPEVRKLLHQWSYNEQMQSRKEREEQSEPKLELLVAK